MAKCPKCASRKGKRYCPGLEAEICSRCCGELRLVSIPCPRDCPYLGSVAYQQQRRQEKAVAHGRGFLAAMHERFRDREAFYFASQLQADIYLFSKGLGSPDNGAVLKALKDLKGLMSKIYVPEGAPHPLALYLLDRLDRSGRYKAMSPAFSARDRLNIIEELIRYVTVLGDEKGSAYQEAAFDFYEYTDLVEDFHFTEKDFAPPGEAEEAQPPGPFRRTASGLILPS
ncbi:MAG: hypothetical protein HY717_02615 [Planctomycetes bacterium]|nr:hypothetical protein [Planctomycetota bacterium]